MHQSQIADKFTIGSGTSCDYIYCDGFHFLKTVGDSIATTTKAREVIKILNEHALLCAVAEAAMELQGMTPKPCGHQFDCVCSFDKFKSAVKALQQHRKSGGE